MFVFLPYATHELTYRRPYANYLLLAVTFAAFFIAGGTNVYAQARSFLGYGLGGKSALGPLSYLFLHADLTHLIGNLLALWLFGNAICSRVGNALYLPLYVALGALAGLVQQLFTDGLTVGASGAINALVGMFLVINPRARMSILVGWLLPPIFRTWTIRSAWFIAVWIVWDIVGALAGSEHVAYGAHLAGFFLGAAAAFAGLRLRIVPLDPDERSLADTLGWDWRAGPKSARDATPARPKSPPARRPSAPRVVAPPRPVIHRPIAAPADGLRRDPDFVTLACACGHRVAASRLFGTDGLRCPRCRGPLAPAADPTATADEPHPA